MNYGQIIGDAFRISWRNRFLWFFGFFLSGAITSIVSPTNFSSSITDESGTPSDEIPSWMLNLGQRIEENVVLFVVLITVFVLLVVLVWSVLVAISRGALVESVAALDRGEGRRFSSAWRAGLSNFWRVVGQAVVFFLIGLALSLVIYLLAALLIAGAFLGTESVALQVVAVVISVIVFLPLLVAISVILYLVKQLAVRALVVDGERVFASVGSGYRLFRREFGRSLILLLIQIGIAIGAGISLFIAILATGLLLSIPVTAFSSADLEAGSIAVAVAGGLILSIPFILITSAIGAFHQAYWTLAYLRLTNPTPDRVV